MGLLDRLFKKKQLEANEVKNEVVQPAINERKYVEYGTGNVVDIYPNGLPKEVLEMIDYSKFGAMLKQEQLLPPSYDKRPVNVEIEDCLGIPRVELTFKSKTSESYRLVGIYKYSVSYSTRMNTPIKVMEVNPLFIAVWRRFAERVMYNWERGYRSSLIDWDRLKNKIDKKSKQEENNLD